MRPIQGYRALWTSPVHRVASRIRFVSSNTSPSRGQPSSQAPLPEYKSRAQLAQYKSRLQQTKRVESPVSEDASDDASDDATIRQPDIEPAEPPPKPSRTYKSVFWRVLAAICALPIVFVLTPTLYKRSKRHSGHLNLVGRHI